MAHSIITTSDNRTSRRNSQRRDSGLTIFGVSKGANVVDVGRLGSERECGHADSAGPFVSQESGRRRREAHESRKAGVETLRTWSTLATMVAERTGSYISQNRVTGEEQVSE